MTTKQEEICLSQCLNIVKEDMHKNNISIDGNEEQFVERAKKLYTTIVSKAYFSLPEQLEGAQHDASG